MLAVYASDAHQAVPIETGNLPRGHHSRLGILENPAAAGGDQCKGQGFSAETPDAVSLIWCGYELPPTPLQEWLMPTSLRCGSSQ